MNCRPGDLAVIVSAGPQTQECIGRLIRVVGTAPDRLFKGHFYAMWHYEPAIFIGGLEVEAVEDVCLRPIRDHGDDAQDESFRWAPAPEKVTA